MSSPASGSLQIPAEMTAASQWPLLGFRSRLSHWQDGQKQEVWRGRLCLGPQHRQRVLAGVRVWK